MSVKSRRNSNWSVLCTSIGLDWASRTVWEGCCKFLCSTSVSYHNLHSHKFLLLGSHISSEGNTLEKIHSSFPTNFQELYSYQVEALRCLHFWSKPIIMKTILLWYYPVIYMQGTTWFSPQATLGSWMFTRGLEHLACGAGTTHRMETRPVATNQHKAYEESYRSTDWCGHSSTFWVTRVGRVCWHASCYSWHPGKLEAKNSWIGILSSKDS